MHHMKPSHVKFQLNRKANNDEKTKKQQKNNVFGGIFETHLLREFISFLLENLTHCSLNTI